MAAHPRDHSPVLIVIALFKLLKGALLILTGIVALKLVGRDLSNVILDWAPRLHFDPHGKWVLLLLSKVTRVSDRELEAVGVGTFAYAAVFLVEGFGLVTGRRWAEYLTVVTTGGLVPLELYELVHHASAVKGLILAINVSIVVYLIARLRKTRPALMRPANA